MAPASVRTRGSSFFARDTLLPSLRGCARLAPSEQRNAAAAPRRVLHARCLGGGRRPCAPGAATGPLPPLLESSTAVLLAQRSTLTIHLSLLCSRRPGLLPALLGHLPRREARPSVRDHPYLSCAASASHLFTLVPAAPSLTRPPCRLHPRPAAPSRARSRRRGSTPSRRWRSWAPRPAERRSCDVPQRHGLAAGATSSRARAGDAGAGRGRSCALQVAAQLQ